MKRCELVPVSQQAPFVPAPLQGTELSTAITEEVFHSDIKERS